MSKNTIISIFTSKVKPIFICKIKPNYVIPVQIPAPGLWAQLSSKANKYYTRIAFHEPTICMNHLDVCAVVRAVTSLINPYKHIPALCLRSGLQIAKECQHFLYNFFSVGLNIQVMTTRADRTAIQTPNS